MTSFRRVAFGGLLLVAAATLALAQPPGSAPTKPTRALDSIPRDGFLVVSVKASALWQSAAMKPVRDWVAKQPGGMLKSVLGVSEAEVDRVTVLVPTYTGENVPFLVVKVTTNKPYDKDQAFEHLGALTGLKKGDLKEDAPPFRVRTGRPYTIGRGAFRTLILADDTSLILMTEDRRRSAAPTLIGQFLGQKTEGPLARAVDAGELHTLVIGLDVAQIAAAMANDRVPEPIPPPFSVLASAKSSTLTADLTATGLKARLTLAYSDAATARAAGTVLKDGLAEFGKSLGPLQKKAADNDPANWLTQITLAWSAELLKDTKIEVVGELVTATSEAPTGEALNTLIAAVLQSMVNAGNHAQASNNLQGIVRAMHECVDATMYFPSDVLSNKKVPWSWRVQLLPYLEQATLYNQLDLQKPWDDPKNKALLEKAEMPKVFDRPGRPAAKSHTYWRSFSQPKGTTVTAHPWLVEGERGPTLVDITNGTYNTIAVVEAGESVLWYAPDLLAYDGKRPLPQLGAKGAAMFFAGFADGSARAVPTTIDEKKLRAMLTRDGGEGFTGPNR